MAEAKDLLLSAEGHLDEDKAKEALEEAQKVLDQAEKTKDLSLAAEATRIVVGAHRREAEKSQVKPEEAERIAEEGLERFRKLGLEKEQGVLHLALAEINGDSRHSKRRTKAERSAKKALKVFQKLGAKSLEAETLNQLATISRKEQDVEDALQMSTEAVAVAQEAGDSRIEAMCLHGLALGQGMGFLLEEAVKTEEAALKLVQSLGIKNMEAIGLCQLSQLNLMLGKQQLALTSAQKALKAKSGNKETLANVQALAANAKFQEALNLAKDGVEKAKKSGDKREEAGALRVLVAAYLAQGDTEQAVQAYEDTLTIVRSLNDHVQEFQILQAISVVYTSRGLAQKAESPLREAISISETPSEKGAILRTLAELKVDMGAYDEAIEIATDSQMAFQEDGNRSGEASALMLIASAHNLGQSPDKAIAVAKLAYETVFVAGDSRREAIVLQMLGELHMSQGSYNEALDSYVKAVDASNESGDVLGAANTLVKLGDLYCEGQRFQEATDMAKRAQELSTAAGDPESDALSQMLLARVAHKQYETTSDSSEQEWFLTSMRMATSQAVMSAGKTRNVQLQATASYSHAQSLMMAGTAQAEEAMKLAKRAQVLYKDSGDVRGEVLAMILVGSLLSGRGENDKSKAMLDKALQTAQEAGDAEAESNVQSTLDALEAMKSGRAAPVARGRGRGGDAPAGGADAGGSVVPAGGGGPMVQMDPAVVRSKLLDLVRNAIGTGEDVEADEALMDAGMDSLSATDFTGQVAREFRLGASPSLVFDYPSVREITQHITEAGS
mmetsp:Transcript_83924/g.246095  ORF Transcript_83924/g.246095 Transcript_83924/m.246095 type:complete len:786 (+) Transcript_83924:61-2418(+)